MEDDTEIIDCSPSRRERCLSLMDLYELSYSITDQGLDALPAFLRILCSRESMALYAESYSAFI